MASISEQLKYILTADSSQFVQSFQKAGQAADKELSKADAKLDKLGGNLTKVGAGAVAFAGVAGAGLVKVALGASDLAESVNAVNVTFGSAAEGILELGEDAARAVGLSKSEFNGLAVQFSSFAETIAGEGGNVVATMDEMTTRVADFASVMNLDVPEAARIFQSALAGETEPIKKFGIDLSAASVAAHAVEIGIIKSGEAMTAAQKTQATYSLLMQETAQVQDDFANTSDGLANQQRILKAELSNLADDIGTGILPMLTQVVSVAGKALGAFSSLSPETKAMAGQFAAIGVAGIGMLGTLSLIAGQIIKMRTRFTTLGEDGTRSLNNMGKAAAGLGVAMGVASVVMLAYAINAQEAAANTAALQGAVDDLSRASDSDRMALFVKTIGEAAVGGKDLATVVGELTKGNIGLTDTLIAQIQTEGLANATTEETNRVLDALLAARAKEIVAISEQAEQQELATSVTEAATGSTEDLTGATDAAASATGNLKSEMEGGISPTELAAQANAALTKQQENVKKSAEDEAKALSDLITALRDTMDTVFDLEQATMDLDSSYAAYQLSVLETATILADSEVSDRDKAQALRDLRNEEIELAKSLAETALKYADESGAARDSAESAQLQKDKLLELVGKFPELRDEVQTYIDILNRVPGVIRTRFEITATGATVTPHGDFIGVPGGARASGGPTRPGGLYEVTERGSELLHEGGRTYLMAGANGSVEPMTDGGVGSAASGVNVYVSVQTLDGTISTQALSKLVEAIKQGVRNGVITLT